MKHISFFVISIFLFTLSCGDGTVAIEVSQKEYGERWPFTVDSGLLKCKPFGGGEAVVFRGTGWQTLLAKWYWRECLAGR